MTDLAGLNLELHALCASLLRSTLVFLVATVLAAAAAQYDQLVSLFLPVRSVAFFVALVYLVVVLRTEVEIMRVIKGTEIWPRHWNWVLWVVRHGLPVIGTLLAAFVFSLCLRHAEREPTGQLPPPAHGFLI